MIKDKYKSARSGRSKVIDLHCSGCNTFLLSYQKDGVGRLFRLYLDRIISPEQLANLHRKQLADVPPLTCSNCNLLAAVPYLYKKEKRPAFRLIQSAVVKHARNH